MKKILSLIFLALLTQIALAQNSPTSRSSLPGWGPFKFGQAIKDAAKAVSPKAMVAQAAISEEFEIEGRRYAVSAIALGSMSRITNISIQPAQQNINSIEECESQYKRMRTMVAKKYGAADGSEEPFEYEARIGRQVNYNFRDSSKITVRWGFREGAPPPGAFDRNQCFAEISMEAPSGPKKANF